MIQGGKTLHVGIPDGSEGGQARPVPFARADESKLKKQVGSSDYSPIAGESLHGPRVSSSSGAVVEMCSDEKTGQVGADDQT